MPLRRHCIGGSALVRPPATDIYQRGKGDVRERGVVLVKDLPPLFVNLVNLVPVPQSVDIGAGTILHLFIPLLLHLLLVWQGQGHVFGQAVGDIDPESLDALVGPESEGLDEIVPNLAVVPVEVGLRSVKQVEVPLSIANGLPGRAAE